MKKSEYKSDIFKFYENFAAMSETRKVSPEEAERASLRNDSNGSPITETEKTLSLMRIAAQLGLNDANKLPYVSGLKQA